MASKNRDHWVVCDEYAAGPFTEKRAGRELAEVERLSLCHADHSIVVSATNPAVRQPVPFAWDGEDD